jgi:hypothetical protein
MLLVFSLTWGWLLFWSGKKVYLLSGERPIIYCLLPAVLYLLMMPCVHK